MTLNKHVTPIVNGVELYAPDSIGLFFLIPTLPDGMCVTFFAPYEAGGESVRRYRLCAKNDMAQTPAGMRVLMYRDAAAESFVAGKKHYPRSCLVRRAFNEKEESEDLEDELSGIYLSKIYGRPSWLQDEIHFPQKYAFTVQVTEADLVAVNKDCEGIFNDGAMFLYLTRSLKKLKDGDICGEAFIQFT